MFEDTHFTFQLPGFLSKLDRVMTGLGLLIVTGCILVIYGVGQLFMTSDSIPDLPGEVLGVTSIPDSIYVDVSGAVEQPGVYQLQAGERVATALEQAGGLKVEADGVFVAQTLNLAEKVTDGQKIYIPWVGEYQADRVATSEFGSGSSANLVSINTASQNELESLPQIGEKRAAEIIQNRPYATVSELVEKEVMSETQFDEIKVLISL